MPDLLSNRLPNAVPIFVPRSLGERPELAALVLETISGWTFAETALGRSVAAMSRGINAAEMETYIKETARSSALCRRLSRRKLPVVACPQ